MQSYKPLNLLDTRMYPGYQFYAVMKYDGHSPQECLCYIALTIMEWLRQKIDHKPLPEELCTPDAKAFARVPMDQLRSYHYNGGFVLDITSIPKRGIWAARIKEPQIERQNKKAVVGRFFVTEIGLHCVNDAVECGIRIDVVDPVDVTEEVPYAYRPAFLRRLFQTKKLRIRQSGLLKYDAAHRIADAKSLNSLCSLIHDPENRMPLIVLTYAVQSYSIAEIVQRLDARLGLTKQEDSFAGRLKLLDLVPETLELGAPVLPYDADYMALHSFGYARVFVIAEKQFIAFCRKLGREGITPGDMLWIEPDCFGGTVRVISCSPQAVLDERERVRDRILHEAHCYSKNKSVCFGQVVFEAAARLIEAEERMRLRLEEMHAADEEAAANRVAEVYQETQQLLELYEADKAAVDGECERLKLENRKLYGRIAALEAKCEKRIGSVKGIAIEAADKDEFYEDEQRDLILSVLREAGRTYCVAGSRAAELIEGILQKNEPTGEGKKLFARLKNILYRNKNVTDSDIADLEEIGFEVTIRANNHYMLVFKGNPRYCFTLASTASEVRGMKNAYSDMIKRISVYK